MLCHVSLLSAFFMSRKAADTQLQEMFAELLSCISEMRSMFKIFALKISGAFCLLILMPFW